MNNAIRSFWSRICAYHNFFFLIVNYSMRHAILIDHVEMKILAVMDTRYILTIIMLRRLRSL